jgi:Domain of unknown function (DUF5069)
MREDYPKPIKAMANPSSSTGFSVPRSSYEKVGGIVFFGRMLDKIRLNAAGKLGPGYFLGDDTDPTWFDGRCSRLLGLRYPAIVERVLAGGSDEEILDWCFSHGRKPGEEEILIWNGFMSKRGWRDPASDELASEARKLGVGDRAHIRTFFDLQDADEGRPARYVD